jgi:hypothetical protein
MEQVFPRGELLFVKRGAESVSGLLLLYESQGPFLWCLGVKQGDEDYVKAGALAALYHFSFQHLRAQGYRQVNLGATRAFLKDGVLQFKRKWGLRLKDRRGVGFLIMPMCPTAGGQSFLVNNPFLYDNNGEWCGACFLDGPLPASDKEWESLYRRFGVLGMKQLAVYTLQQSCPTAAVPERLRSKLVIRSAESIFDGTCPGASPGN